MRNYASFKVFDDRPSDAQRIFLRELVRDLNHTTVGAQWEIDYEDRGSLVPKAAVTVIRIHDCGDRSQAWIAGYIAGFLQARSP